MIKNVLFDVGGTLHINQTTQESSVRFAGLVLDCLKGHGIELPVDFDDFCTRLDANYKRYKRFSEETHEELLSAKIWHDYFLADFHLSSHEIEPLSEQLSFLMDSQRAEIKPRSGLGDTLEQLKQMNLRMGIISNIISTTFIPHFLSQHNLSDYFDFVLMSSQCGIRKPDRRIFEKAFREMAIQASECAFVGDTISRDVIGSRNANVGLVIQIDNPLVKDKDVAYQGIEPDIHIKALNEIPSIIHAYNQSKRGES